MNPVNDRDRFDRFTERARKVLSLAQEEAQRFQHNYIGTEHLLLGLVREGEGVAARVLESMGVELYKVRQAVEFIIGRGDRIVLGEIGLTPRAKKVIELAVDEARRLSHHYIGTEHLLLGLIREEKGIASLLLQKLDVDREAIRTTVEFVIAHSGSRAIPDVTGFTPRSHKVIRYAIDEAYKPGYTLVGTEHLLLALLREGEGIAAGVLISLGLTFQKVYALLASRRGQL